MKVRSVIPDFQIPDIDGARSFYEDFLGLGEEEFNLGWVARFTNSDTRAAVQVVTEDETGPKNPVLSLKVDDIGAAYAEAQASGFDIVHPLLHEEERMIGRFMVVDHRLFNDRRCSRKLNTGDR